MKPFRRDWGRGAPVIALHPLGLDSSGFAGFAKALGRRGMRTIALDLPGFGRTPAPAAPLSAAVLAAPVIELARALETPPVLVGISLGGRVALEAALTAPEAFRAVIAIAPALPWRRYRFLLWGAALLDPSGAAAWLPLERIWPGLHWLAGVLETVPFVRDDEMAQAGARFVYYLACPATRASFFSAAREMALDPADGPAGFWTRLARLDVATTFVWGERDQLIPTGFANQVARVRPDVPQLLLPCVGHWINGPHHRCLAEAIAGVIGGLDAAAPLSPRTRRRAARPIGVAQFASRPCLVDTPAGLGDAAPAAAGGEYGD